MSHRLYEDADPAHEDEAFTPEDILNTMLPAAERPSKGGNDLMRFGFAASIFDCEWLSSGKAARLA